MVDRLAGRRGPRGLHWVDVTAIVAVVLLAMALLLPALLRDRRCSTPATCANHLEQMGRAIAAYYGQHNDYYPYRDSMVATDSLALIYPQWVAVTSVFTCDSADDEPSIAVVNGMGRWFGTLKGRAMSAPLWSSYGYDMLIHPRSAGANHVVAGDMDKTFATNRHSKTTNHSDGGNFLRFDGHVSFETTVYCSNNPLDHIFEPQSLEGMGWADWQPDTDSWIRRP